MTELSGVVSKAYADEGIIEDGGEVFHTGKTTLEVMAEWEDWLANDALERMLRMLRKQPGGEDKAIKAIATMSAEGAFDFYGQTSATKLGTPSGIKQLIYLRVKIGRAHV